MKPWHFVYEPSQFATRFKRWYAYALLANGLLTTSSLALAAVKCSVLSSRARARRRDHQVPRVPLPDVGITFIREPCADSSEDITPRSSLLQTHSPILHGSPRLWLLSSFEESVQVATSPCCHQDLPDVILRICPAMPEPIPRRVPLSAFAWFFPSVFGLPKKVIGSASRFVPRTRFFVGLLSRLQLFRYVQASQFARLPDRSHRCELPRRAAKAFTSEQNVRRYLRTHRICYPPDSGNWRNEDFHLARFAALSAAPECADDV